MKFILPFALKLICWGVVSTLMAAVSFATARIEAVRIQGSRAARLYESLKVPITEFAANDKSYVVFVKEKEGVKCSALTKGDVKTPGHKTRFGCEVSRKLGSKVAGR